MSVASASDVVARVAGVDIGAAAVERLLGEVRESRFAALLPPESGAMGRQLRRWLVQLVTSIALAERHAAAFALPTASGLPTSAPEPELSATAAVELGTMPTALLRMSAAARAVFWQVTEDAARRARDPAGVRAYYERNRADFRSPERRLVSTLRDSGPPWSDPVWIRTDDLSASHRSAVLAAAVGEPSAAVAFGAGRIRYRTAALIPASVTPYTDASADVARTLAGHARRQEFVAWLERERHAFVELMPGYEHPADPTQPDNTHRH